ncbi:MAG: EAL domain-containing protein [Nitriliruptor sp.]|uniref:putative bifunctional diguanylate cyclase/phosphodiesterase n=1 Tax=Nitriliruptor sp. TaxID=2448056 RepID=UPI00349FDDB9
MNFKTRANDVEGDIYHGFDWTEDERTTCERSGDEWTCVHRNPHGGDRTWTFSDAAHQRMRAQIHNPADGCDEVGNALTANTEPDDPAAILGNFTHEELPADVTYLQLLGRRFAVTAERQQILELLVGAFADLVHTNQQLRERELQLSEAQVELASRLTQVEHERARLAAVLDAIPDGVVIVTADGRITDANPTVAELGLGPTGGSLGGTHVRDLPVTAFDDAGRELSHASWPIVRAYHEGYTTTGVDLVLRTTEGRTVPVTVTAAPVGDATGEITDAVAVIRDVSTWAFHDRLTALPNRTLFTDRTERALVRSANEGAQTAVLVVGIDRFTVVHDSLGRGAEDSLVVAVARRLVSAVREDATVGRLSSDRFGILLGHVVDVTDAVRVAARITDKLQRPVTLGHEQVFLTASIGVTTRIGDEDAETLLRQASTAMNRAVAEGGARCQVYDEQLDAAARHRLFLDAALRKGIEQDEFRVHFQPVVELDSGRIVETEALVRWQHPERGLISPGDFIPLAEESGLIVPLGRQILERACHQTQIWRGRDEFAGLGVSVNLSARQFEDPDLETDIRDVLTRTGLPAAALTLEMTESALIREPGRAAATLSTLRSLGVRIAIDDFGTGYSSLSYLRTFPIDVLKIDRSFVQRVAVDEQAGAIVQAIITLAHALGLAVVAEGVETDDQLRWLREAGCQRAAGFLLSRPVPAEDLPTHVQAGAGPNG